MPVEALESLPRVSVVIPTYNRRERLARVLKALASQQYPQELLEVVVVSDGSTDGTDEFLATVSLPIALVWDRQANRGPAAARNRGIRLARGELVVFIDDDVVPDSDLIAAHVRRHAEATQKVVVIGPMLTPADFEMSCWARWEQDMLDKQYRAMRNCAWDPTARQFYTGNASVARASLLEIGGFDTSFRRAEDVELAYRLAQHGLKFVFEPAAIGLHYAERDFEAWLGIARAYGRNDVLIGRDQDRDWLLPTLRREYDEHHVLVKRLAELCVPNRWALRLATFGLRWSAMAMDRLGLQRSSTLPLSGLFAITYYAAIADELGGWDVFWRMNAADMQGPEGGPQDRMTAHVD